MADSHKERAIQLGHTISCLREDERRLEAELAKVRRQRSTAEVDLEKLLPSPSAPAQLRRTRGRPEPPAPTAHANGQDDLMDLTRPGSMAQAIIKYVLAHRGKDFTMAELAKVVGKPRRVVKSTTGRLVDLTILERIGRGQYRAGKLLKRQEQAIAER